jgi:hypothetical protein
MSAAPLISHPPATADTPTTIDELLAAARAGLRADGLPVDGPGA